MPCQQLRLRLTGPLFYDASHRPCVFSGGKVAERHAPERRSIWEIHPIYRIEVYDSMKQRWLDLDRWAERGEIILCVRWLMLCEDASLISGG